MRPIKFKCWDGTKMWKHAVPLHSTAYNGGTVNVSDNEDGAFNKFVNGKLLQFTGLKDKNGKEIFEGDLVTWTINARISKGIVTYVNNWGGYDMKNLHDDYHVCCDWLSGEYEIIGNIYENISSN